MIPSESSTLLEKTHSTEKKDGLVNEWEIELVKRPWHIKSIANFSLEKWKGNQLVRSRKLHNAQVSTEAHRASSQNPAFANNSDTERLHV
ncbi:hypothetical protein CDAR_301461 [Caerostris darwini]|uniref:Uncharacterized protein n=1 Tax=Caerostris darwini TaxID=1538125 RepID=A0AAV4WS77_9ARAC|nr:hypothetical protein CDAR_301461 [Caerostris darwini]